MIVTRPVEGIVPVVLTPFLDDGNVDHVALERLVNFLVEKPIAGLWVLGTGSEDMNLTFEKRLEVARTVCNTNAGRAPLILGAGFFAFDDILRFFEETASLPADGYHVMPYHNLISGDRLEWFYKELADRAPRPLWMYTSGNWSSQLSMDMIERLKAHPNMAGIKYSNVNAVLSGKVCAMQDPGFQIITAVASQLYPSLCMGSPAHTSSLGSALPESMIEVYDHFKAGRHEEALAAQRKLNKFLSILGQCTKRDNFIQAADEKYILSLRGICSLKVSSYYRETSEAEQALLKKGVQDLGIIE